MTGVRQDLRRRLHGVAFGQAGYFTAAQAKDVGYSHQAQKYHVDHGNWLRVDRGLFRLPEWPSAADDSYARWSVWSKGRGVVSHDSALVVHDLSDASPARIHLTVPDTFHATDDAVVLHRAALSDREVEQREGFRVTDLERTLVDVAGADVSQEIVDGAIADAVERGQTSPRRLRRRADGASDLANLRIERALATLAEQ